MKQGYWNILAVLAVIMSAAFFSADFYKANEKSTSGHETIYERIIRTNTIRCGYIFLEPSLVRDEKTGVFSGIMYDLMQEIAKRLNLKLEMTVESSYGNMGEDIRTKKSDLICAAGWAYIPNVRAHIIISKPVFYSAIGVYVRKNDGRFLNGISGINNPSVTITAIDGSATGAMAREFFPKAKILSMAQSAPYAHNLLNVVDNKADVAIEDVDHAEKFLSKQNDKTLKNITKEKPLRVFSSGFIIPMGEVELEQMINVSVEALINEGFVDKLLTKYESNSGSLIRVARPYEVEG